MKIVFSENNGEYLNKKPKNEINPSTKDKVKEVIETKEESNLLNRETI